jgi:hypothetical protein
MFACFQCAQCGIHLDYGRQLSVQEHLLLVACNRAAFCLLQLFQYSSKDQNTWNQIRAHALLDAKAHKQKVFLLLRIHQASMLR